MKQVIVINKGLKMRRGKEIAQGCHASIGALKRAPRGDIATWEQEGTTKVVLQVKTAEELEAVREAASKAKLPVYLVKDAGRTEIKPGSITALGIGPASDERIDRVTDGLKLY